MSEYLINILQNEQRIEIDNQQLIHLKVNFMFLVIRTKNKLICYIHKRSEKYIYIL